MNLKQTIRRVLIQETKFPKYLRRRTTMDDLDTAFEEASNYIISNNTFNYLPPNKIKIIIINVVMDHLHPKFSNWGMEEFDYDKIHEFLMSHYSNKMDRKLNISNKEETNESELTEKCWKGYTQKGMKTMFGKRYPNCVKKTKK